MDESIKIEIKHENRNADIYSSNMNISSFTGFSKNRFWRKYAGKCP